MFFDRTKYFFARLLLKGVLSTIIFIFYSPSTVEAGNLDFPQVVTDQVPFGYVLSKAAWTNVYQSPMVLTVCWENLDQPSIKPAELVRKAISESWSAVAAVQFRGWDTKCGSSPTNIRILIADIGPYTKGLGREIDNVGDGMVLNFAFKNWGTPCQVSDRYESCVKSIAVHEFGHALGFAHEQNRPDTPGECADKKQGGNGDLILTPWDIHSVMNYCNPVYNNDGRLSSLDISSVQKIYGIR